MKKKRQSPAGADGFAAFMCIICARGVQRSVFKLKRADVFVSGRARAPWVFSKLGRRKAAENVISLVWLVCLVRVCPCTCVFVCVQSANQPSRLSDARRESLPVSA